MVVILAATAGPTTTQPTPAPTAAPTTATPTAPPSTSQPTPAPAPAISFTYRSGAWSAGGSQSNLADSTPTDLTLSGEHIDYPAALVGWTESRTISWLIKFEDEGSFTPLYVDGTTDEAGTCVYLRVRRDHKLNILVDRGCGYPMSGLGGWGMAEESTLDVPFNVYTHLTLTYDHATRNFAGYIAGNHAGYNIHGLPWHYDLYPLARPLLRPARLGDNGRPDHSRDCEVRAIQIWMGAALSATEVSTLHATYVATGAV